jgi:hypothetical protein
MTDTQIFISLVILFSISSIFPFYCMASITTFILEKIKNKLLQFIMSGVLLIVSVTILLIWIITGSMSLEHLSILLS